MRDLKIHMVDTHNQYLKIKGEIDLAIHRVIDSSHFIMGPAVREFEQNIEKYLGCKHAIGCASGTDALLIAMMALGIKPGDEVITSPFTFVATTETIAILGARPVYADIDEKTYNIDVSKIEERITARTKAIMPVHLYGQPAEMDVIMDIAGKRNLFVIEDAAQALGAEFRGRKACTIGNINCISFYPSKNLGAFGDAGMVTTNDSLFAQRAKMITTHGSDRKYYHEILGINSRLDSIQAAILNVKLKYLDEYCASRQIAANKYTERLSTIFEPPYVLPHVKHIYHQYSLRVDKRDALQKYLSENGIPSMIYYPVPLHLQKAYKYDYSAGDFPVTEKISEEIISLPMHTELTDEQIDYICDHIKKFYRN